MSERREFVIDPELDRASGAYHEAGHAVVAAVHGHRFRYISMNPMDPDSDAHVVFPRRGWGNHPRKTGRWLTEAMVDAAGLIAQYFYPDDVMGVDEWLRKAPVRRSAGSDMKELRGMTWWAWSLEQVEPGWSVSPILPGQKPVGLAVGVWQRTVPMVAAYREAVEEVAMELQGSRRAVTYHRVRDIVGGCAPDDGVGVRPADLAPWFLDHSLLR